MTDIKSLRGIIGACLTPFDEDGHVNASMLEQELGFLVNHCDGISILSVEASEYRYLSEAERRQWLQFSIAAVESKVPVIAGASDLRIPEVLELAELSAESGADLVQVLIPRRPWGLEPTTGELMDYFTTIAERSPLPVVVYHNPPYGADPSIDTLIRLSEIDGVVAMKDSSRDSSRIGRLARAIDQADLARYFTTMQPLFATLAEGGSGAMMPPPGTLIGAQVVKAYDAGNLAEASEAQRFFSIFPGRWGSYGLPPVMKSALKHLGLDLGGCAPPFASVSPEDDEAIGKVLADRGIAPISL